MISEQIFGIILNTHTFMLFPPHVVLVLVAGS